MSRHHAAARRRPQVTRPGGSLFVFWVGVGWGKVHKQCWAEEEREPDAGDSAREDCLVFSRVKNTALILYGGVFSTKRQLTVFGVVLFIRVLRRRPRLIQPRHKIVACRRRQEERDVWVARVGC